MLCAACRRAGGVFGCSHASEAEERLSRSLTNFIRALIAAQGLEKARVAFQFNTTKPRLGFPPEPATYRSMKVPALLTLAMLACAMPWPARGEDFVYLRQTGSASMPRYEVLTHRPLAPRDDVIQVPAKDVANLDKAAGNYYVVRTSASGVPARYAVRVLPPGVSYMQSIGGGYGGGNASPKATPPPAPGSWQPRGTALDKPAERR